MKIAVTFDKTTGEVFGHFGHTEAFKIYDCEDGKVKASEVVTTEGKGHGALASFLSGLGVDTLICGGIGVGAQLAIDEEDIEIFAGVTGSADESVELFLKGELKASSEANCEHHHHHDHDEHCTCGCHDHDHDHEHDHEHEHHHHDHDHDHDCCCGEH